MKKLFFSMVFFVATTQLFAAATVVNTGSYVKDATTTSGAKTFTMANFSAGAGNKLIVTTSSEGRDSYSGGITSVTYGGRPLTVAVAANEDVQMCTIYYLDDPASNGDIVVNYGGNVNGIGMGVVSVLGVAPGGPIATASAPNSTSLTVDIYDGAVAVIPLVANGAPAPGVDSELTTIYTSGSLGSASGAAGYEVCTATESKTYSFTTTGSRPVTVAAVFEEVPVLVVPEDGSNSFTVSLAEEAPSYPYTVNVTATDITTLTAGDPNCVVEVSPLSFSLTSGTDTQIITVTGIDNSTLDGDFVVTMGFDSNILTPSGMVINVIDDESPEVIITDADNLTVAEGGVNGMSTTDSFTISLSQAPIVGKDVIIDLATPDEDPNHIELDTYQVVFTSTNYAPQTVTVSVVDNTSNDDAVKPYTTYTKKITTSVTNAADIEDPIVTIYEDDCGATGYSASDLNRDCNVDMVDLAAFATGWLDCTLPNACN